MRVLLVTHRYPPDGVGGVERYVERLGRALAERGDKVAVVTRTPKRLPRRPRLVREDGVYRIAGSGVRLREFLLEHAAVEAAFVTVLRQTRPELVHVNHLIGISPRIVSIAHQAGVPVVLSAHDYFLACPLVHLVKVDGRLCSGPDEGRECAETCFADEGARSVRWITRYDYFHELLALLDRVLCPSAELRDLVAVMAPAARVELLPLGVDSSVRAAGAGGHGLTLACVGTAARHKGVFRVVEALRRTELPATILRVIGRFDRARERDALRRAAASVPGLELELHGEYDVSDLPQLLSGVDAVVAASEVPEAFPLAPREALAAGVPVVAVRLGGLEDVVEPEVNGLLVEPFDEAGLSVALRRLALEPGLRARLSAGARGTAVPSFADHVTALRKVYESVVEDAQRHGSAARFEELHEQLLESGLGRRR